MADTRDLTGPEVERRIIEVLRDSTPPGWSLRAEPSTNDGGFDLLLALQAPDAQVAVFALEVKTMIEGRDVPYLAQRLARASWRAGAGGLVGARYLSPQVRDRLKSAGLGYVDATGNVRIEAGRPGLLISQKGADTDPWRRPGRPRGTLKGEPAARIVRAIIDIKDDWSARELAETARVSTGATYRVMEFLDREGLAERDAGRLKVGSWVDVMRRWSDDYGFVGTSRVTRWLAPRGLDAFLSRAASGGADLDSGYAVTGTIAAAEWAPYAPARSAMIYVTDPDSYARQWDLRPTDAAANVLLAEPQLDVPFIRNRVSSTGLRIAAPAQVAVDLMTGPGRNPSEAEELIEWMRRNEPAWRG